MEAINTVVLAVIASFITAWSGKWYDKLEKRQQDISFWGRTDDTSHLRGKNKLQLVIYDIKEWIKTIIKK